MNILSVFVDKSGDFGEYYARPSYYLVTMVFHDQRIDIQENIRKLEQSIQETGFSIEYIHSGPVIRREHPFKNYSLDDRRRLLSVY